VSWHFPYLSAARWTSIGLAEETTFHLCYEGDVAAQSNAEEYRLITKGRAFTEVYDCDHALRARPLPDTNDPSSVQMTRVRKGSVVAELYSAVCARVLNRAPYPPE